MANRVVYWSTAHWQPMGSDPLPHAVRLAAELGPDRIYVIDRE